MTAPPICTRCNDTHRMLAWDGSGEAWPCTGCPRPCDRPSCRKSGISAYCDETPCACECHARDHQYAGRRPPPRPVERFSDGHRVHAMLTRLGLSPDAEHADALAEITRLRTAAGHVPGYHDATAPCPECGDDYEQREPCGKGKLAPASPPMFAGEVIAAAAMSDNRDTNASPLGDEESPAIRAFEDAEYLIGCVLHSGSEHDAAYAALRKLGEVLRSGRPDPAWLEVAAWLQEGAQRAEAEEAAAELGEAEQRPPGTPRLDAHLEQEKLEAALVRRMLKDAGRIETLKVALHRVLAEARAENASLWAIKDYAEAALRVGSYEHRPKASSRG